MRRWSFPILLLAVVAPSRAASAASLSVEAAAPCLDEASLAARVERDLEMPLGDAGPLRFEVSVAEREPGYEAHLSAAGARGGAPLQREIRAADCAALEETLAVAMTLALSAEAGASAPAAPSTPRKATGGTDDFPARDSLPPEEPARASEADEWRPQLSAGLLVDAGTLPVASLGAIVGATMGGERFQLQALGTWLFDRDVDAGTPLSPDAAASLGFIGGGLLACALVYRAPSAGLSSRACLGWELGRLSGVGSGVARPRTGRLLWSAPRADVAARMVLAGAPWGFGVSLTAEAPINRDDFTLGEETAVHRPPVVVGRAAIGIDLVFD